MSLHSGKSRQRRRVRLGISTVWGGANPEECLAHRRLEMLLVDPAYHPLVRSERLPRENRHTPIEWLNDGMKDDGVVMRLLPVELTANGDWKRWRCEKMLP